MAELRLTITDIPDEVYENLWQCATIGAMKHFGELPVRTNDIKVSHDELKAQSAEEYAELIGSIMMAHAISLFGNRVAPDQ